MKYSQQLSAWLIVIAVLASGVGFVRGTWAQSPPASGHTLKMKTAEATLNIAYPANWSVGSRQLRNGYDLYSAPSEKLATANLTTLAHMLVAHEQYPNHAEALRQLRNIAAEEEKEPAAFLNIGGWPALQRRFVTRVSRPGDEDGADLPEEEVRVTTAIAAGSVLVRLEARIPLAAGTATADDAQAIGQTVGFDAVGDPVQIDREIRELQRPHVVSPPSVVPSGPENTQSLPKSAPSSKASPGLVPVSAAATTAPGLASAAYPGLGEIEVTATSDGRSVVLAGNGGAVVSGNAGKTFVNAGNPGLNDSSLAVGVSGTIYMANIGSAPGSNTTAISRSTNGGSNFVFVVNAVACSTNGPGCTLPDQEHIAADRRNIAPGGGDQVYSVWRLCTPGCIGALITFSTNSGASWSAPITVDAGGDFPRITVGQDGFVYVTYAIGGNRDGIRVKKYSSAANGLVLQSSFDVVASGGSNVPCPVPGLDRCNNGNVLASPTLAVDDTNPTHIYVAYANNTAPGNEDVFVQDSTDGGATFPGGRVVRVNTLLTARRYMPWVCSVGGTAFVSWYDRRASASSIDNSFTDFYSGSALLDGGGNLVAGTEFRVSPVSDSGCASGWPCAPRSTNDSESCSFQPELAGVCSGTVSRCDFSTPTNCAAVPCLTGGGCPKYGDYNGVAGAAGRVFYAWESATNPQGFLSGFTVYTASKIVCCVPQVQIPGNVSFVNTCVGTTNTATLTVCNTGKADLEIGTITSSSSDIRVIAPSAGYPVIVSPDFCFPFQVQFVPTSAGAEAVTLTVPSNDPASPAVTVTASGAGTQPSIATLLAGGGRFGIVCSNSFEDLPITITDNGGCDLVVNNITSSSPEFVVPSVVSFPLVVQAGTSLQVPIRLQPTSLGIKSANITVTSSDPNTPTTVIPVSGITPPGEIRVTGSTSFGDVCAGAAATVPVSVCNVGPCNLRVSSVSLASACPDFTLVNNPFPATVSPDSCLNLTIRFTPTSCGPKACTLVINNDSTNAPVVTMVVTGNTPCASIDVPPDQCFPPTVIQSVGACSSAIPFPILNKGACPLNITSIAIGGANVNAYSLSGLPSFPINLQPGHTVGDGGLNVVFAPSAFSRDTLATLTVTYETDPVTHATTTITRTLNGEGVRTGARVLVTFNGVPVSVVDKIMLQRVTGNRNKGLLNTVDNAMNLPLTTVTPSAPCTPFHYHREYSTVSNPIQLLPGSYVVSVTATVNGKKHSNTVGFDVSTCTFNQNIVVSLP